MKRFVLCILIFIGIFFMVGCNAHEFPRPNMKELFTGNQVWIEQNYDLIFYYSPAYEEYEFPLTCKFGRLKIDKEEIDFFVSTDEWGGLYFEVPRKPEETVKELFSCMCMDFGDGFYEAEVFNTNIPNSMPNGTILHFSISNIELDELYIPDYVGARTTDGRGDGFHDPIQ